jgi:uncharacterized protein (DUF302 family)
MQSDPVSTDGIVTKPSPRSVADTVHRLLQLIDDHGLMLFAVIDHSGLAEAAGLPMPDTKLVIFGSPAAGTPVMIAAPLAALDLPLKVLVWAGTDGAVSVSYNAPAYLATRYHLTDDLRARLDAIEALTSVVVGRDPV